MPFRRQMFRSSMVVGFFTLLGGLTGLLVETSIAAHLGLSKASDTFYVAFTVPYLITNLISATGQFSLVPFFAALDARQSAEEQWQGFSYAVNIVFLGSCVIAVVGAATAPWVIRGIAPGFTPAQTELASKLGQWLFLIIIPAGVAETLRSFLLSQGRFAFPSAAGFFRNAIVIVSILLTFDRYEYDSIVLGYLLGYFFQLAVLGGQILVCFQVRYSLTLLGSGQAFRNLRGAGTAQLAVALAWQGVVVVERIIASFLPPGTLTALNYGLKIMSSLTELLAGSVGTVTLPGISRAVARKAQEEESKTFRDTLKLSLVLVSPVMVFCLLLDRSIIRLIFERGNFTADATILMATVFFYYTLSLLLFAAVRVLTFYLFARNEAGLFFRLSTLQYGLTVAFDLLYVGVLRIGAIGIPLSLLTSLLVASGLAFRRNLGGLKSVLDRSFGIYTAKNLMGTALAAFAVWGLRSWVEPPQTSLENFFYLGTLCGAGGLVFIGTLVALRAFRISQLTALWQQANGL